MTQNNGPCIENYGYNPGTVMLTPVYMWTQSDTDKLAGFLGGKPTVAIDSEEVPIDAVAHLRCNLICLYKIF